MLYQKHNFLNRDIKYIKNTPIVEYDMKNAGLNILFHNDIISEDDYNSLNAMGKERHVVVGKFLAKNKDVNNFLIEEFVRIRKEFFELNEIRDDDVLSIKKDALYLINKTPKNLQLNDHYIFRPKSSFSSFININNKEHYYNSFDNNLETKGYSNEVKEHHSKYLFGFLKNCLNLSAINNKDNLFTDLLEFKHDFVNFDLDKGYYKDIIFDVYLFEIQDNLLYLDDIKDNMKHHCEINSNLDFILNLINIIL